MNHEGHIEATAMLTIAKTIKVILIKNAVVLSSSCNIAYTMTPVF